ncbi:hypothetical protein B0H15DRAFT_187769 [Mycena belliarum]|uniref:Uncharacterized protein n=1 Tax=Mycena belliarum TaxID=1033014 RepID=A0AAD6TK54_9AGAR|nr:hypothetical protein B0H15DRAFT_187769 [Mycena belliae]
MTNPCICPGSADKYRPRRAHSRRLHRNRCAVPLCGFRAPRGLEEAPAAGRCTPQVRNTAILRTDSIGRRRHAPLVERSGGASARARCKERQQTTPPATATYRAPLVPTASSRSTPSLRPSTPAHRPSTPPFDPARCRCGSQRHPAPALPQVA